jgi:hypothetical protein
MIEARQHDQHDRPRQHEAPDDRDGERLHQLRALAQRQGQRSEGESRGEDGHRHGTETAA